MKTIINRKILVGGLLLAILLSLIYKPNLIKAASVGDANINTSGKELGTAASGWYWDGTNGARISIVDGNGNVQAGPVDFFAARGLTPKAYIGSCSAKTQINGGLNLTVIDDEEITYSYKPLSSLPRLVAGSNSSTNLDTIISYFTDEDKIKEILDLMGTSFTIEDLVNQHESDAPENKKVLMIEPIVMAQICVDSSGNPSTPKDGGKSYQTVMSATDAAAYDSSHQGGTYTMYGKIGSLTHMNLPFGLFLQKSDCGMTAYTGSTRAKVSSSTILSNGLGVGLVTFGQTMATNPDKITMKFFIDKGSPEDDTEPNGFYDEGIDKMLYTNVLADWVYASGVNNGTQASPNDVLRIMEMTKNPLYAGVKGKSPIRESNKDYVYNSTYVSDVDGADHSRGLLYEGSDYETGWGSTFKLKPTTGNLYYFYMGYIDQNQKKKVTIHYLFNDVEDLNEKIEISGIDANSVYNLNDKYKSYDYCKTTYTRQEGDKDVEYSLTGLYWEQDGNRTIGKAAAGSTKGSEFTNYWTLNMKFTMTSNVDVYVCYTSPQSYKATLQYVTENGKGLSGTLADNTTAKTQSVTITEGTKVRGTEKFPVLNGTAYKTLTTSDGKEYEITGYKYQVSGSAAVSQSADNTAASTFFGKELTVTNSITYQLIYKEKDPPEDDTKYTITLHYRDESGNDLKAAKVISVPKDEKDTKFKITDKFPELLTEANYETLKVGEKTYEIDTAKYQFAGDPMYQKRAGASFSAFFDIEFTMKANLDYYLFYKAQKLGQNKS